MKQLYLLSLFLLFGCGPNPIDMQEHSFPFQFEKVVIHKFNWKDKTSFDSLIAPSGNLNKTVNSAQGIELTESQILTLSEAIFQSDINAPIAACFYPHHGFEFFNKNNERVAYIDICFLCNQHRIRPNIETSPQWDLKKLSKLVQETGLPLANPNWKN